MNSKRKALWTAVAIASATLAAGAVRAQDEFGFDDKSAPAAKPVYENYVELGGGYTDDGNGKFGEYTSGVNKAFQDDGGFAVGSLNWGETDAATATAWQVTAGSGNGRNLTASYGVQGDYGLMLYTDRLQKTWYGDMQLVYPSGGDTFLLQPGFKPGVSTQNPAAYMSEKDIATTRTTLGLDGMKTIGDNWTLSFDVQNQNKEGDNILGANQGFSGTAYIPAPVDYNTDIVTARGAYAEKSLQSAIEVSFSKFENGDEYATFQNAQIASATSGGKTYPLGLAQIALPPDNEYLRLSLDGGYNFNDYTRLSWFGDWSRGEQDEDFLSYYHNDPGFYPSIKPTDPRYPAIAAKSLDGEVERTSLKLALVGRPLARFDYRLEYEYKDRDAQHDPYSVLELSYQPNSASSGFSSAVYDKETNILKAEGGYRFGGGLRLRAGYEYEAIDRTTNEAVLTGGTESFTDKTDDDLYWAELKLPEIGALSTKLRAEYADRSADLSSEMEDFISPNGVLRRATPFFLLDRTEDVYEIDFDYALGAKASVYAQWKVVRDDFDNDTYGLDSRDSTISTLGATWSPRDTVSMSVYGSFERYKIDQKGAQMGSTASPYQQWTLDSKDTANAYGVSLDWTVVEDRFDLSADFAYIDTQSDYDTTLGVNNGLSGTFVGGSTPDSDDTLYRLNLVGTYTVNEHFDVIGRYIWEERNAEDWGWSQSLTPGVATTASAVGAAYEYPDYTSQAAILSVRYKF
jgi:MtrB/PioB family decaheme-associated outer membrane protein